MRRIVYGLHYNGRIAGGHKVILRHVEALRDLGFDAVCHLGKGSKTPDWFNHRAPIVADGLIRPHDDIVVLPDDGTDAIRSCAAAGVRTVVLVQNPYYFAASESFEALDGFAPGSFPTLLAVAPGLAATLRRLFPQAQVAVIPCFADERIFRPAAEKSPTIVYTPRKRQIEGRAIPAFLFPVKSLHRPGGDTAETRENCRHAVEAAISDKLKRRTGQARHTPPNAVENFVVIKVSQRVARPC